jgi:hypothetical protein
MTKRQNRPAATPPGVTEEQFVQVESVDSAGADDVKKLMAEIKGLREALKVSEVARTEAEAAALAAAEAQGALMQRDIVEVPTGKFVNVKRAVDPETGDPTYKVVGYKEDGREILKPIFHDVKLPTFFYKIDLPAVGGLDLKTNDASLYHGVVYQLDIDTLRSVKERVYRLWQHDQTIHGSNENAYRPKQEPTLSMRSR